MTTTSTYKELWAEYDKLRDRLNGYLRESTQHGLSMAEFVGSELLEALDEELVKLLEESEGLPFRDDREKLQAAINALILAVEIAMADAQLYECDPEAGADRFLSTAEDTATETDEPSLRPYQY